jgi:trans-aconitate methyltransferase
VSSLERSWGSFSAGSAAEYLRGDESSAESKEIVAAVVRDMGAVSLLDLGCGNGELLNVLKERQPGLNYTGVDFSEPLLECARREHPGATFVRDDVERVTEVAGPFDVVVYSHVLEMLSSPQASLRRATRLAPVVVVRFFEPPEHDVDLVELREMDVGGRSVPYLRRSMSRDYYRLILADAGCESVDVYRCESSRDQVHVLRFPWPRY